MCKILFFALLMSLFISSINSGSNGNCYYIGNENEAILIDVGITCTEVEKRIHRLGLNMQKIKAVFVSHEHSDHISGIAVLSKKYKLPIYVTPGTLKAGGFKINLQNIQSFSSLVPVHIGDLSITPFPKSHDAADPHSFVVCCNKVSVGIFTDIGYPCKNVINQFKLCHAAFLETNYDDEMLEKGKYPFFLKSRIRGEKGHLSNAEALKLFSTHKPPFMSHLFLSHLSKNNNRPELVQQLFNEQAMGVKMIVATRYVETPLFHIHTAILPKRMQAAASQLSFSFA
ncbi:MAG: MBL fold metallo-hydrolase [Ginsengibacter sp.]